MATSLLNGCALVIDDEINEPKSSISNMIAKLEAEGTLFVKSKNLPADNARGNLSNISFIILDWDIKSEAQASLPDDVQLGGELRSTRANENNTFIKDMLTMYFVPIFIFSQQEKTSINMALQSDPKIADTIGQRVFIESKSSLTGKKVKSYLEKWLKSNRTVFALKMFEEQLSRSKNAFLIEVGGLNSEWANLVYNTIKLDHIGGDNKPIQFLLNSEFREFLTNSLLGRMDNIDFGAVKFVSKPRNIIKEHIDKVFESIKFYKYGNEIDNGQAYEGDIYQQFENGQPKNEYLININAPCDLRKEKMLLLVGKTKTKYRDDGKTFFQIPCFAGKASIEFRFDDRYRISKPDNLSIINIIDDSQVRKTYKRIGRITPPYITATRNEFAHFISRQGIPRHPK